MMILRLIRSKGVFEFIRSAREIQETYSKVHFLLIGGEDGQSIDRLTSKK